jgi:O-antigen/teichoic acid export membrane protein
VRQFISPYILIVVATGRQHLGVVAAIAEACVNIVLSIWLVQKIGAVGVAIGTLVGAFVGVGIHVVVSMHLTQSTIQLQRRRFLSQGLFRPLLMIIPSLFLYPFWRQLSMLPAQPAIIALWVLLTLGLGWTVGLRPEDRLEARIVLARLLYWRAEHP